MFYRIIYRVIYSVYIVLNYTDWMVKADDPKAVANYSFLVFGFVLYK